MEMDWWAPDRPFCLTDDGCSGKGELGVIKQFIAPESQPEMRAGHPPV